MESVKCDVEKLGFYCVRKGSDDIRLRLKRTMAKVFRMI